MAVLGQSEGFLAAFLGRLWGPFLWAVKVIFLSPIIAQIVLTSHVQADMAITLFGSRIFCALTAFAKKCPDLVGKPGHKKDWPNVEQGKPSNNISNKLNLSKEETHPALLG